jgi:hypothetical protein
MTKRLTILILLTGLVSHFSLSVSAQLVKSYKCEDERVQPNFHVTNSAGVHGVVLDASGETFSQIVLQIRKSDGSTVLKSAAVNDKGQFDFGTVPSGEYRLVPAKLENNQTTRIPGFDPPRALTCSSVQVCELNVVLPVRPTDLPYTNCAPK